MLTLKRIFLITLISIPLFSLKAQVSYNDVKAVFMERFTRFIDWPANQSTDDTFIIMVIDDKNFYNTLSNIHKQLKIKNRNVQIKHITNYQSIDTCQMLFIGSNMKDDLENILKISQEKNILTVSDTKGFAQKGTHINFYLKENQVRFEMNEESLKQADFTVSYLLLNVAKIVRSE